MAKVTLICPFCQKKLETIDENVGREGQCPFCQHIVPIRGAGAAQAAGGQLMVGGGWMAGAQSPEYRETAPLLAAGGVALMLLLLAVASFMPWVRPGRIGADVEPAFRGVFLGATVICLLFLTTSFAARKSLVPAVLVSLIWGLTALVWLGGLVQQFIAIGQSVPGGGSATTVGMSGGLYIALAAALFLCGVSVFFYIVCRDGRALPRIGIYVTVAAVLGLLIGVSALCAYSRPQVEKSQKVFRSRVGP